MRFNILVKLILLLTISVSLLNASRLISIGGSITETVIALGHKDDLVAIDLSSIYPQRVVRDLPTVGYWLSLPKEGILSMKPDIILVSEYAKPKALIKSLPKYGIKTYIIDDKPTIASTKLKIQQIAKALNETPKANQMITRIEHNINKIQKELKNMRHLPKVLFLFSKDEGIYLAAGNKTKVGQMVKLAGGVNPIKSDQFVQISNESIIEINPDVIIYSTYNSKQDFRNKQIKNTNAMLNSQIYYIDMVLASGFTVRLDSALKKLSCYINNNLLSFCK